MIILRFHGSLHTFLPHAKRAQEITLPYASHETVKNLVETCGVPHAEVGALLINLQPVDFAARASDGDRIDVFPCDALPAGPLPALRPPLPAPRFILDAHLGRLAASLRMLGYDTLYRNDFDDDELARISHDDERMLLTRDVGLLKRGLVRHGMFVRATDPSEQIVEIVRRCGLQRDSNAFKRCVSCNTLTVPVEKTAIMHLLEAKTIQFYETFRQCPGCGRIYWPGSHYQRMVQLANDLFGDEVAS